LQKFEPYGVGAENLQQCLIIQLRKYEKKHKLAIEVIKNHYTPFTNKNFEKIIKNTSITEAELKKIYKTIEELNPIPSNGFSKQQKTEEYITPDFIINLKNNIPILILNKSHIKPIKVSKYYSDLLENTKDKNTKDFLKQKVEKAKWFSEALKNREKTLEKIMRKIIDVQSKYFKTGEEKDLIPMKLADIAEKVNMDISTISRFSNAKYVETHFGTFKLKEVFSEPYKKIDGQIISTKLIKSELKNIIENEDKKSPFTDEDLTDLLSRNEYYIARRTVAKYRDSLGIKIAKLRRAL
jgi:RNA polymerase sigma-54 factor